ncbi:MAG: hypothetical protein J3K34DRAFT_415128 [Monoraphidium minutum]|nr:MAG: hypothetical protein J3K34DRAFT_415128 [Monoraphidium minutum]
MRRVWWPICQTRNALAMLVGALTRALPARRAWAPMKRPVPLLRAAQAIDTGSSSPSEAAPAPTHCWERQPRTIR